MKSIVLVIDGFGIGESEDADLFDDCGSDTYGNLKRNYDFKLDNFEYLGLNNIDGVQQEEVERPRGSFGRLRELSVNKDSLTGHWEMMGIVTDKVYQSFPNDIDDNIVKAVQEEIGQTLCNHGASGTQIINELGQEHIKTKQPILYSSGDSVLQIATHKSVYSVDELYAMCMKVRERMNKEFYIQRIIARPFDTNEVGEFYRTTERKDFSIDPTGKTTLDEILEAGFEVMAVGKIADLFNNKGITESYKMKNNLEELEKTLDLISEDFDGLIFTNLGDTDTLYGHRNDSVGYINALKEIDAYLPKIMKAMSQDDLLIITGDHGNDPTTVSTDHSREFTPFLVYNVNEKSKNYHTLNGFRAVGDTALNWLLKIREELENER